MEFDLKGKKLLSNRSDGTCVIRINFHLCLCSEGQDSNLPEKAQVSSQILKEECIIVF